MQESPAAPASDPSSQLRALQCRVQLWLGRNPPALPLLAAVDLSTLAAAGLNVDGAAADGAIFVSAAAGPAAARLAQQLPWDPSGERVVLEVAVAGAGVPQGKQGAGPGGSKDGGGGGSGGGGGGGGGAAQVQVHRLCLDALLPHACRLAEESTDPQVGAPCCAAQASGPVRPSIAVSYL